MKTLLIILLLAGICNYKAGGQAVEKPNVIFIIIDDLNDYTETLGGHPQAVTPGISRIENLGTTFLNAYTSSPKCAPSRTSFLTGKDLAYTQVYNNPNCKPFRDYFKPSLDNEEIYTLPEYMKDNGGYFTYGINKIYHCFDTDYDYDFTTDDPCTKSLSWSKYSLFVNGDDSIITHTGNDLSDGMNGMEWAQIPDSIEKYMYDKRAVDSAALFIHQFVNGEINTCDRPFFMMVGLRKPHLAWFIPEHYYLPDYISDYYAEPFNIPYNTPNNAYPPNGVIMPPQPDTIYNDYFNLPEGGLAQYIARYDSVYFDMLDEIMDIDPLPEIDPGLSDEERIAILEKTMQANAVMAYLAATKSVDAQINRLMDSLENYPEIYSNTILVVLSDHGYSLGEKRHWQKGTLWETDLRVPLVIADLRNPVQQVNTNPVSLLDLFPTLCEMTETPYPTFADSTPYLDGRSFKSMLDNPELIIEKPSLSSYKEAGAGAGQCNCFPQHSVRSDKFHYIFYTSNNADWLPDCNGPASWHEEELYEIGHDHEVDPNEWHNLINDSAYRSVVDYLQQWLPDSAMYLQIPYTADIQHSELNCLLDHDDTLQLYFNLYDTTGIFITPPSGYLYQWTNNLTTDTLYGTTAEFLMQSIPGDVFDSEKRIMFLLQMIDTSRQAVVALDNDYFYLDPDDAPTINFSISTDSLTVTVSDVSITGSYNSAWWDFDDGYITYEIEPGPHTYAVNAMYTITCYVQYGNNDDCLVSYSKTFRPLFNNFFHGTIHTSTPPVSKKNVMNIDKLGDNPGDNILENTIVTVFPNPSADHLTISCNRELQNADITIRDVTGRLVYSVSAQTFQSYELSTGPIAAGNYVLEISNADVLSVNVLQIIR